MSGLGRIIDLGTTVPIALAGLLAFAGSAAFVPAQPVAAALSPDRVVVLREVAPAIETAAADLPETPVDLEVLAEPEPEIVGASYYGRRFAGRPTASGEIFDPAQMTAAHRTLPFGTLVKVTNTHNGKSVTVRINDRGPFHHARDIDLSRAAAEEIGMVRRGHAKVTIEPVG
ncbi:septal ring lytic transglycosylase RlpA family protein [Sphingomicrobium astaxanthinifaciens]|uniref:septal ring lytic transglycosylase RlpA family protein n=1 Tax=Sphingomicrobium astaxanthinifaciens TaxID=1227949 RepID=UPI001FCB7103|nr:septal ring lytic transglycosylase RlpA family protein [Sphingomicrobium astaxanthinifaciens]MCJ7421501.1 septal ring lytic transglycosylase RlpA family protein [Sphingomicrobium astaxanthinifaciens]